MRPTDVGRKEMQTAGHMPRTAGKKRNLEKRRILWPKTRFIWF